jgi:hypothetical protein
MWLSYFLKYYENSWLDQCLLRNVACCESNTLHVMQRNNTKVEISHKNAITIVAMVTDSDD